MADARIGMIGVGKFGENHARLLAEMCGVRLAAVYDQNADRCREIAGRHGTLAVSSPESLLPLVDGVVIVSPTVVHREHALPFLEAGKPVFIEKPLAKTLAEADDLAAVSGRTGVPVQVGHIERFNPVFRLALPHITEPRFIEVDRLSPFPNRSLDIDVVMDLMIHDLDLVSSIVRRPVTFIHATGIPVISSEIDMVSVRMEFEGGCVANLTGSRVSLKKNRQFRVFLNDRYLSLDLLERKGMVAWKDSEPANPGDMPGIGFEMLAAPDANALRDELDEFAQVVRGETLPTVPASAGRDAVALAERVLRSVAEHHARAHWGRP